MLRATPASWFSWDYQVERGTETIARLTFAWSAEAGGFVLGGRKFEVQRNGFMGWVGAFQLSTGDQIVCNVRRPNLLVRRFELEFPTGRDGGGVEPRITLLATSVFRQKYLVRRSGVEVGRIRAVGFLTRKAEASFSEELPMPIQLLLIWLMLLNWRRAESQS